MVCKYIPVSDGDVLVQVAGVDDVVARGRHRHEQAVSLQPRLQAHARQERREALASLAATQAATEL